MVKNMTPENKKLIEEAGCKPVKMPWQQVVFIIGLLFAIFFVVLLSGCTTDGTNIDWNRALEVAQNIDQYRTEREAEANLREELERQTRRDERVFMIAAVRAIIVYNESQSLEAAVAAADAITVPLAGMTFDVLALRIWFDAEQRPDQAPVSVVEIMDMLRPIIDQRTAEDEE